MRRRSSVGSLQENEKKEQKRESDRRRIDEFTLEPSRALQEILQGKDFRSLLVSKRKASSSQILLEDPFSIPFSELEHAGKKEKGQALLGIEMCKDASLLRSFATSLVTNVARGTYTSQT